MERNETRRKVNNVEKKKNNKWKGIFFILLFVTIFIYYQVFVLFKYTTGKTVTESQMSVYKWIASIVNKTEDINQEGTLKIGVVGNIAISNEVTEEYIENGSGNYDNIFSNISFGDNDFNIANLNTVIAKSINSNYSYIATTSLLDSLRGIDIDLLNISTKELAAQKSDKLSEITSNIKAKDINYVGGLDKAYYILEKNGVKVAILSYVGEDYSKDNGLTEFSSERLEKDLKEIKEYDVDCIILFIDTLRSNSSDIKEEKENKLKKILEENVNIIISNDSVEQSLETVQGKGSKTKYIKYALGDVIGVQEYENSDISKTLVITVEKKAKEVTISVKEDKTLVALSNEAKTKYKIVDLEKEIKQYNAGSTNNITEAEYKYLCEIKESNN